MSELIECRRKFRPNDKIKLISLFKFLKDHNLFYRPYMSNENINEQNIDSFFNSLPIVTKKEIRHNYQDYISRGTEQGIEEMTSGSSGVPLKCLKTKRERMTASMNIWKERKLRDPEVCFDNFINLFGENVYKEIGNFIDTDETKMAIFLTNLLKRKPRWISAPISVVYRYARLIDTGKVEYNEQSIRFIEFFGEYVSSEQRGYIENIFHCSTINHYGTKETWCIAYECHKRHLHIQDHLFIMEKIKPPIALENSQVGELLVTSLYNKLMPFIRYNLQDLGDISYEPCECGKNSPVLNLYGGRTGDIVKGMNVLGNNLFNRIINRLMRCGHDVIDGFRVEQHQLHDFVFFIEKSEKYTSLSERLLIALIVDELGEDNRFEINYVEQIPRLPSGKLKNFHSFV